jgi:hypothetical protein
MSLAALTAYGLFTPLGAAGAAALALTTVSSGLIVLGLVRTAVRLTRQVMGRTVPYPAVTGGRPHGTGTRAP